MTYEQALEYIRKWTPQGLPKQWLKALDIVRFHGMDGHDEELKDEE